MKTSRQSKIIELIQKNEVETQEELSAMLESEGFSVTQATVSRDIRELKLTKIPMANGRQKYAVISDATIATTRATDKSFFFIFLVPFLIKKFSL